MKTTTKEGLQKTAKVAGIGGLICSIIGSAATLMVSLEEFGDVSETSKEEPKKKGFFRKKGGDK